MVPPYSHRVSRVRRYSGYSQLTRSFTYETITLFGEPSHVLLLDLINTLFCPNPEKISSLGLASSAFARHYLRNLGWFLFLALLRCFSSGGFPHIPIWFSIWYISITYVDCSIRKSADQCVLTTPRSLSQLITSFFGSQCQGIRPALFLALPFVSCSEFSWIVNSILCSFLPDNFILSFFNS